MTTRTYTIQQQVAAFTFSVNSAADLSFASLQDMQNYVTKIARLNLADTVMQGLMGSDWALVWGPVVWVDPSQSGTSLVVDNTLSCYYSPSQKLFVVAVAGTNPTSMFDWEKEDFEISSMVEWSTISPASGSTSGYVSTGTATGMNALLNMKAGADTLLATLKTYIQTNRITDSTIAIGGHSLGGALAPCLGLYLYDNLSSLGLSGQNISVYAYAGPTPGNQVFATYYEGKINTTTFTYSSIYNTIDIIPQGSVLADLATIPTIYGSNIPFQDTPPNTFLGVLVTGLEIASYAGSMAPGFFHQSPYTQIATNRTAFTASFNSDVLNNCSGIIATELSILGISQTYMTELSNFINVMYQAVAQHGPSYCGGTLSLPLPELGELENSWTSQPVTGFLLIDDYTVEYQKNLTANPPANAVAESGIARTIKRISGLDVATISRTAKVGEFKLN